MIPEIGGYYLIHSAEIEIQTGKVTPVEVRITCTSNIPEKDCCCKERVFEFETVSGYKFYFGENEIIQRLY